MKQVTVDGISIGDGSSLVIMAGPCVVENREIIMKTAERVRTVADRLSVPVIFKSSFKKANRTSLNGFTGIGRDEALNILREIRSKFDMPVITDVHSVEDVDVASDAVQFLQIPAFLCRQTDLLIAAGNSGLPVNIKKGQFVAPEDMAHAAEKVASTGNRQILLCERGSSFGYHDLVVDMRGLVTMRELGYPVVMDATHAVQIPSEGGKSGGRPEFIFPLARAAAAVGIDALFVETHPNPRHALSDAGSQLHLDLFEPLLANVLAVDRACRAASTLHNLD